jgi:hypothetical protein
LLQVRAVILGLEKDQALLGKLKPLFVKAYDLEIPVQFVPVENADYHGVHVVQDTLASQKDACDSTLAIWVFFQSPAYTDRIKG